MADNKDSNSGQPQQINLRQIAQQFMFGLQRHFDMLAFNLASHDMVQEDAYTKRINEPRIMPSSPHHQNFEQLQAYAHDLLIRQIINDSLNLTIAAMNNAHFFLTLVKAANANKTIPPEAQKEAQAAQQEFARAPLDQKFDRLEKDYSIMCELEDSIVSLGFVLQIMVQQGGVVKKAQLNDAGELAIELKSVQVENGGTASIVPPNKLVDVRKVYREGDTVTFSDVELQLVLVTIASFADSLFKAVAEYARSFQQGA